MLFAVVKCSSTLKRSCHTGRSAVDGPNILASCWKAGSHQYARAQKLIVACTHCLPVQVIVDCMHGHRLRVDCHTENADGPTPTKL